MAAHPKKSLWHNTPFQLMWTSAAASGFGDRVMMSAALALMGAWGAGADTTAAMAANSFFFFLPYVIFSIPGGWLADKLPRKVILMGCDFARAAVLLKGALMIAAVAAIVSPPIVAAEEQWKVCVSLLAVGSLAALFYPARYALIPALVGQERVQMGNAVIGSITLVASMLGLVICGEWMDPKGPDSIRIALFVAVGLYTAAGIAFAFMRVPRHGQGTPASAGKSKASGAGYILSHRRTLNLNLLYLLVWAVAMLAFAAVPAVGKMNFGLLDHTLQKNASNLGAAMGVGLLFGAVFMAVLPTRRQGGVVMMLALVPTGLGMAGLTVCPWMPLCFACAFVAGFFGHITMIGCVTLIQSTTPDYVLGRVMGLNSMLSTVGLVGVNLIVGLPALAEQANHLGLNAHLPAEYSADQWILRATGTAGLSLAFLGAWYGLKHLTRGPMPNRTTNLFHRIVNFLCLGWHQTVWIGRQHVPAYGSVILSMNHTAAVDPFLVQAGLNRMVRWLMADKYMFKVMQPLWSAINPIVLRRGQRGGAQIRTMMTELKKDCVLGIFPEGGLQRMERTVHPFKIGVAVLAKKTGVPVVPVWIHGTAVSDNIAVHAFKPSRCTVIFGKPIVCAEDETEDAFLMRLRAAMLALRAQVPASRRCYEEPDPDDAHPLAVHSLDD